ncbi:TerB family tellurite resistance protein [bacterium]|nr:TerB family tellurite resistance protein [bacterium]
MSRWQNSIHKLSSTTEHKDRELEDFFKPKNYQPVTDEEIQIFDEFSLIVSSMAILIYVANADKTIDQAEKEQIVNDMLFQMEQRPYEFSKLSKKFGDNEKEVILNIYDKLYAEYQTNKLNLDKILEEIYLLYQNNPEKRYYLIRLCFFSAMSDNVFDEAEKRAIHNIALSMDVATEELDRIEMEVKQELQKK